MHEAQKSDVSSENQFILTDSFEAINPSSGETIETIETIDSMEPIETIETARIARSVPDIFVESSNIDEIVEDGKMNEFMDYIERIDYDRMESDKLQFREYFEQPKRTRNTTYNYEADNDNVDELADFCIVENVDVANDENNESDEHEYEPKDLMAIEGKVNSFESKRAINTRKPNMFALAKPTHLDDENENENLSLYRPVIRITPTEDERVEQFLHENCEQTNTTNHFANETLIKSKTTQLFECSNENNAHDDVDSFELYSRANSPSADTVRDDSLLSDSDMIQFECKQPPEPNYFYNREDSSSSYKSNVLFERSQSRFSELEYIKGRDDWKDSYVRYDISQEIDSDNYHHSRRHSEAADTLEYIRGREDWLRNEQLQRARRISLPKIHEIHETHEPKIVIQDEIDSDEYHHNFFQNEYYRSVSETNRETSQTCDDVGDGNGDGDSATGTGAVAVATEVDGFTVLNNEREDSPGWADGEWRDGVIIASNNKHPMAVSSNVIHEKSNEINKVIENLITHDTTNNEDIEITVLDLPLPDICSTPAIVVDEALVEPFSQPFILISEAKDENLEKSRDENIERNLNQTIDSLNPEPIEIPSIDNVHNQPDNIQIEIEIDTPNIHNAESHIHNDTNEFLSSEIYNENLIRGQQQKHIELETIYVGTLQSSGNNRIRAKSERPELMRANLLSPIDRKPRRTLSFENVEDLIQEVSQGPWFHK